MTTAVTRRTVPWGLVAVAAVAVTGSYLLALSLIYSEFLAREREEALRDIGHTVAAFEREAGALARLCLDWASRDGTYQFAKDGNAAFIESNLVSGT